MFDVPVDAWYTWIGLAVASVALFGVVSALPTAPPPDAVSVADTVDRVASAEYVAAAEQPLDSTSIRLGPRQVGLRNHAGTTHAPFVYGPVTPATNDNRLRRVLDGAPPSSAFESRAAFEQAVVDARATDPAWRPVDGSLVVRHVTWEGYDVTLVGA